MPDALSACGEPTIGWPSSLIVPFQPMPAPYHEARAGTRRSHRTERRGRPGRRAVRVVIGGAALAGLAVGIPFGAVAARSRLCANSAVREAWFGSDRRLARIFLVAVGVQLALLPVAIALGVDVAAPRLYVVAGAIGGFAFGVGMALAGGCASGILWRSGTGRATALLAIAGFGAGELLIRGPLISLRETLDSAGPASRAATLDDLTGVPYAVLGVAGAVVLAVALRRSGTEVWRFGVAIGVIGVAAWIAAQAVGYGYGLGFVGTAANIDATVRSGDASRLTMEPFLALGVVVGAALGGRRRLRFPNWPRAIRAAGGGVLMGVAGTIAHGCNIGHALTGLPLLSVGSIEATLAMIAGVAVTWGALLRDRPGLRGHDEPRAAAS